MCIEKFLGYVEFLTPGDYRQRRNREKFQIMDGTNFLDRVELLRPALHWYRHAAPRGDPCRLRQNAGVTHCNRN
jgi:hypothetical protein